MGCTISKASPCDHSHAIFGTAALPFAKYGIYILLASGTLDELSGDEYITPLEN